MSCIDRKCDQCGTNLLKEKLKPISNDEVSVVKWNAWGVVKSVNPKTEKEITKRQEVVKSGPPSELVATLIVELESLSVHLFEAWWQQEQFSELGKNFPEKAVVLTIDFAENYTCFSQNEIQGAHWTKDSVTIHPCIALYRCPKDNVIIDECVDIISNDLLHDSHAVHKYTTEVMQHLKVMREIQFEHVYVISDGCAAHYKSKVPFMDISCSIDDHQVTMERCFYGSRHGKNRCDGEAGVLKSMATRAVKNRETTIQRAEDFYKTVKILEKKAENPDGSCIHTRRTILWIDRDNIVHQRSDRDSKTVHGTRKLHSILGVRRGEIKTRRLSCFCVECTHNNPDGCLNADYVDTWKAVQ